MSLNNVRNMYVTLLKGKEPTVEIQEKAFSYAEKQKDVTLFIQLLNCPNLDPNLEKKISLRSEADILVVWASNKARTTEQLLERFKKESRTTLLTQLAERDGLPKELYLQLAKMGKPTLSQSLLKNTNAPDEAKIIAAKYAVSGMKGNSTTESKVQSLFEKQSEEVNIAAISTVKAIGALAALTKILNGKESSLIATQFEKIISSREDYLNEWHNTQAILSIFRLIDPEGKARVRAVIKNEDESGHMRFVSSEIKNLINAPDIDPIETAAKEILTVEDHQEIDNLITQVERSGNRRLLRMAIDNAVLNPYTKNLTLATNMNHVDYRDRAKILERIKNDIDALTYVFQGYLDSTIVDAVFKKGYNFLDNAMGDGVDNREFIKHLATISRPTINQLTRTNLIKIAPSELLPYADVTSMLDNAPELARQTINDSLAGNAKAWVYFENLLPDWENSLPDLLLTATTFASEESI